MFERFTDRARKVMALANQEAQRFNHEYIGTEHILLGLVKEGSGVGANVLKNLEIDLRKLRLEIEKLVKDGPPMVTIGKLPQTPRAKHVLEHAILEARSLDHNYVGTEHLLLGLLYEKEGVAAHVLKNLGVKLDEVREEVLNLLGAGQEKPAEDRHTSPVNPHQSRYTSLMNADLEGILTELLNRFDTEILGMVRRSDEALAKDDKKTAAQLRNDAILVFKSKYKSILEMLGIEPGGAEGGGHQT